MKCIICGFECEEYKDMGEHVATDHPEQWEMAVQIVALGLLGPG